jgi:uncharacterized protein YpuA (DUF1002 family)
MILRRADGMSVSAVVLLLVLLVAGALPGAALAAAGDEVVTLGVDLNEAQRLEMLDLFDVDADSVRVVEVTNREERAYFEGSIPDEQLGTRSISCVYVQQKDEGDGISVETKNISYVTPQTYANALVTAGVADAEVYAAAPFSVSGTAALTGIFKAFEEATGEAIPEQAKEVASEELAVTATLGEETGDTDAIAALIAQVKQKVIDEGLDSQEAIRQVVIQVAAELNITLTEQQINQTVELIVQIQKLNLDPDAVMKQLKSFQDSLGISDAEAQGLWEQIKGFFSDLWDSIFG